MIFLANHLALLKNVVVVIVVVVVSVAVAVVLVVVVVVVVATSPEISGLQGFQTFCFGLVK